MTFTPATSSHPIVAIAEASPPPMASFFFASDSSRSSRLRSSSTHRAMQSHLVDWYPQFGRGSLDDFRDID